MQKVRLVGPSSAFRVFRERESSNFIVGGQSLNLVYIGLPKYAFVEVRVSCAERMGL